MSSLLWFILGVVVGPFVWLFCIVVLDFVISSYEYARVKREAMSNRMKEILKDFGMMK